MAEGVVSLKSELFRRFVYRVSLAVALLVFWGSTQQLQRFPRVPHVGSLSVVFSPAVQLFMSGGDRFLAANLDVMRATFLPVGGLNAESAGALAVLHRDATEFNPRNEDNYYIAQAVLPWFGQVKAGNEILLAAAKARSHDFLPYFFLGFNEMYFNGDYSKAGGYFLQAAERTQGKQHDSLVAMSAKFYEKGDNPDLAIAVIKALQDGTHNPGLKQYLQIRILRLQMLKFLRAAATRYEARYKKRLSSLEELVRAGVISAVPIDPLGIGFELNGNGTPVLPLRKKD